MSLYFIMDHMTCSRVYHTKSSFMFVGYTFGDSLDPFVTLYALGGEAEGHGFRVQPTGIVCTRFVQPGTLQLASRITG